MSANDDRRIDLTPYRNIEHEWLDEEYAEWRASGAWEALCEEVAVEDWVLRQYRRRRAVDALLWALISLCILLSIVLGLAALVVIA